ncbi:MAG: hypothetical protein JHC57_12220 [Sphingopyxis sp.]|uniref:hypothetical protein n=1 Tax=Sphingopyxis sp. TaxID=1908224 RepID=UPI001A21B96D|nr:hypothetical protein [Sphingopyxis sp.]MBJ7500508.1 hypothetical protein [Sphingopyxis sp.]
MDEAVSGIKNQLLAKRRRSRREISQRKRDDFIQHLSETCNVTLSAERTGVAITTFYRIRRRDAAFAAAWQGALDDGYRRLEMGLVQAALAVVEGRRADEGEGEVRPVIAPMTMEQALQLLKRHEESVRGGRSRPNRRGKGPMPTPAETDEAILKRLAVLRRQRGWDKL